MTLERQFELRKSDIEEIFHLLDFIVKIESHKNESLLDTTTGNTLAITQEMQCAFKAEFLLLLYNIVESTTCDCLNSIYDAIIDDNLAFADVSTEIKKMWRNYLKKQKHPDADSDDTVLNPMKVKFGQLAISISGSLDYRKIVKVFRNHGCMVDDSKGEKYGHSFLIVKNRRNLLAHGNISFSECGSGYIYSDLKRFKEDILEYLDEVMNVTKSFIEKKEYKNSSDP